MDWKLLLTNSILLGVGLAIDAFSVSVADTMAEPHMARRKKLLIASVFAIFQTLMPLMGWFFVRAAAERFLVFQKAIPYIALLLLLYLGFKMIMESRKSEEEIENAKNVLKKFKAEVVDVIEYELPLDEKIDRNLIIIKFK